VWFEKVVKKEAKGFVQLIRYADDFVVCFQIKEEAEAFGKALEERLNKFGLKIAKDKSKTIKFGRYQWMEAKQKGKSLETFDFLGFTHYCDKTRTGKFKLGRKTAKSKFRHKIKELNQWMMKVRNQERLVDWWNVLKMKLVGHYHYYGISGNIQEMQAFYRETIRLAHKWINRRSEKKSYNWKQFLSFMKYNSLPRPKIYHSYPNLSSV